MTRPLKSLDLFAGAGGLTCGLEQSGVAKCHWAVESNPDAAQAFKINNKGKQTCSVGEITEIISGYEMVTHHHLKHTVIRGCIRHNFCLCLQLLNSIIVLLGRLIV